MRIARIGSLALMLATAGTAAAQPNTSQRFGQPQREAIEPEDSGPRSAFEPTSSEVGPTAFTSTTLGRNAFRPGMPDFNPSGFYGRAEYLLWWLKRDFENTPPLVTLGDPADNPTGAVGQPGTSVVFGGFGPKGTGPDPMNGGRATLGFWFGETNIGLEATFFGFQQRKHTVFTASGTGDPGTVSLNLSFFNNDAFIEDALNVALDGVQSGNISFSQTQRLWGAEFNMPVLAVTKDCMQFSPLFGLRYLNLQESVDLRAASTALPANQGIESILTESHATRNHFYGGQIGAKTDFYFCDWRLTFMAKIAAGVFDRTVNLNGTVTNIDPVNGTVVAPGGLYVGPNNLGSHANAGFGFVPEVSFNATYNITENLALSAGYTFLYCSNVFRPGDEFDRVVNFQVDDRPRVLLSGTDFWAHGINLGAVLRY